MSDRGSAGPTPIVLLGIPRSGTTWAMQVLGTAPSLRTVLEPDNEGTSAPAVFAKRRVGRFPALGPSGRDDRYHRLWAWILSGAHQSPRLALAAQAMRGVQPPGRTRYLQGHRVPLLSMAGALAANPSPGHGGGRRLLVKSVHAPLAAQWLAANFDIDVVVMLRHPGNVLASWIQLNLNERYVRLEDDPAVRTNYLERWGVSAPGSDPLERMVFQIGVLMTGLEQAARAHPNWVVRTHEQLCVEPTHSYRGLFDALSLTWGEATDGYLASHDRQGGGFLTERVAAELPDAWARRLSAHELEVLQRGLAPFPLRTWSAEDLRPGG